MENSKISSATQPIKVNTLGMDITLPEGSVVSPYQLKNQKKPGKNTKQKQKYNHFSYYLLKDKTIVKLLFLNADTYLQISKYPFIKQDPQIKNFKELNDLIAKRLITSDSLLIGIESNDTFLVRKLEECHISEQEAEIDTIKDIFQSIPQGNKERYNHVLSTLNEVKLASLRVIINEEGQKAEILDFDYFFTEKRYSERFKIIPEKLKEAEQKQKVPGKAQKKALKTDKKQDLKS